VIDVFVEELDLSELGFGGVDPEATGRPSYHPSVLLKLYIYGYLNRVQSSRRLEREAARNVEVMWLTGRLVPDHKTIAGGQACRPRPRPLPAVSSATALTRLGGDSSGAVAASIVGATAMNEDGRSRRRSGSSRQRHDVCGHR
jgi:hypothetical protein